VSTSAILEGHEVVRVGPLDPRSLAMWGDPDSRRVAFDTIGDVDVSTVFLGIDHGHGGIPLWFETMTFGPVGEHCWRYTTWDEAERGHAAMVRQVREGLPLDTIIEPTK